VAEVEIVLLAVQDGSIAAAAAELATGGGVTARHVVLHLSGMLDQTPLAPLARTGAALGVFHPLQAIAQPETAPERLRGALAVLTGDARAIAAGETLARSLGLRPVVLPPPGKVRYHAAAAIASNYLVVLAIMAGTLDNLSAEGPAALTGPIARGDVATVRAHLAALPPGLRTLYTALGRVAVDLAPLDGPTRAEMNEILGGQQP
jgi:predicted short-subunit dehydrogenase-like oxidoreductase (DUF2520 family)